jgi:hypothetical protein
VFESTNELFSKITTGNNSWCCWNIAAEVVYLKTLNSSFRCIDDVLPLNNYRFCDYLHLIYQNKLLGVKDTHKSASYLDLHTEIDKGGRQNQNFMTKMMISVFK